MGCRSLTDENGQNQTDVARVIRPDTWLTVVGLWLAHVFLFCATAAVVVWQNSRITVLYDLCGVLEPAYRMSLSDRPYADFPFPYAPLTFLIQSWIIQLWGTVYWHHVAYSAVIAGLATVLTWRILLSLFRDSLLRPALTAFLLSLPLIPLGVYCIFPHPFYDPDAMFFILISIALILWLESRGFSDLADIHCRRAAGCSSVYKAKYRTRIPRKLAADTCSASRYRTVGKRFATRLCCAIFRLCGGIGNCCDHYPMVGRPCDL